MRHGWPKTPALSRCRHAPRRTPPRPPMTFLPTPPPWTAYALHWRPCSAVSVTCAEQSPARSGGSAEARRTMGGTNAPRRPPGGGGNYRLRLHQLRTAQQDLRTREAAVGSSEEEILAREQDSKQRIANTANAIPAAERTHSELRDLRVRAEEEEKRLREDLADQETTVIDTGRALREALDRPEVINGAGWNGPLCPTTSRTTPVQTPATACARCVHWPTRWSRPSAVRGRGVGQHPAQPAHRAARPSGGRIRRTA
ncbi:hypothetical protein NKH18_23940 [Streptomyces sp. M10(2022)]